MEEHKAGSMGRWWKSGCTSPFSGHSRTLVAPRVEESESQASCESTELNTGKVCSLWSINSRVYFEPAFLSLNFLTRQNFPVHFMQAIEATEPQSWYFFQHYDSLNRRSICLSWLHHGYPCTRDEGNLGATPLNQLSEPVAHVALVAMLRRQAVLQGAAVPTLTSGWIPARFEAAAVTSLL